MSGATGSGATGSGAGAEWKAHWRIAVAAMTGTMLSGISTFGVNMFMHPLEAEFGWSRAGISMALTITATIGMIFATLSGRIVDRIGPRRMVLFGVSVYCLLMVMLSQITPDIRSWWAMWVMMGLVALCNQPAVWSKAVTSYFDKGRGTALALMTGGTGLSAIILPSLGTVLMDRIGWRMTFVVLGCTYGLLILPIVWFWFFDATDKPADPADQRTKAERLRALPGWTAREGLRRRQTYQIAIAGLFGTAIITGYNVHFIGMMTERGIARAEAAAMLSVLGLLAVISRLVIGRIFDAINSPLVGMISIVLPAVPGLILLFGPATPATGLIAAVAVGLAIGGEFDAVIYLSSRFFGLKAFGVLFGLVTTAFLAGVALGPLMAGRIFDVTRSYELFYLLTIPAALISMAMVASLGPYPDHARPAPAC